MGLCVEKEHCGSPSSALQGKKKRVQNKIVSNTDKRILQVFSFHMEFNNSVNLYCYLSGITCLAWNWFVQLISVFVFAVWRMLIFCVGNMCSKYVTC